MNLNHTCKSFIELTRNWLNFIAPREDEITFTNFHDNMCLNYNERSNVISSSGSFLDVDSSAQPIRGRENASWKKSSSGKFIVIDLFTGNSARGCGVSLGKVAGTRYWCNIGCGVDTFVCLIVHCRSSEKLLRRSGIISAS